MHKSPLPPNHRIYRKWGREEVDVIVSEIISAIPQMHLGRRYDAEFLTMCYWDHCAPGHHRIIGNIVSELIDTGYFPIRHDGRNSRSTRIQYFLVEE